MNAVSMIGAVLLNVGAFGAPLLAVAGAVLLAPLMLRTFRGLAES